MMLPHRALMKCLAPAVPQRGRGFSLWVSRPAVIDPQKLCVLIGAVSDGYSRCRRSPRISFFG
jgi:hypothetical protein